MSMKVAFVKDHTDPAVHPCEIKNAAKPKPKENEVLVQIKSSGCCFTDVHAIIGDWPIPTKLPLVPGHEGVGVVVEKGDMVDNVQVGDRVGIQFLRSACGFCEFCVSGWESVCVAQTNAGFTEDGCMGEFALGVGAYVAKIPQQLTDDQAAPLMCAGVTVYKGIKETEARPGQFITIIGAAGGLGHLAIQYARAMGLRVIALDVGADKRAYCQSLGAELALDLSGGQPVEEVIRSIQDYTGGGSHAVLLTATDPSIYGHSVAMCRRKGTIVCLGIMGADMKIPIADLVLRRITIRGSNVGTRKDTIEALDFAVRGLVRADVHTVRLEDINQVYAQMTHGEHKGRSVVQM